MKTTRSSDYATRQAFVGSGAADLSPWQVCPFFQEPARGLTVVGRKAHRSSRGGRPCAGHTVAQHQGGAADTDDGAHVQSPEEVVTHVFLLRSLLTAHRLTSEACIKARREGRVPPPRTPQPAPTGPLRPFEKRTGRTFAEMAVFGARPPAPPKANWEEHHDSHRRRR